MGKRIFDKYKHGLLVEIETVFKLFIILFIVFQFIIGFSRVSGKSMEPTFSSGDIVFYNRINFNYKKGEVVAIKVPNGDYYIKRIVAVEGDTVDISDGSLYINGQAEQGSYINGNTYQTDGGIMEYPYTLKEGEYFVLGDNREVSNDSRSFGPIEKDQIKGKIWSIFY